MRQIPGPSELNLERLSTPLILGDPDHNVDYSVIGLIVEFCKMPYIHQKLELFELPRIVDSYVQGQSMRAAVDQVL